MENLENQDQYDDDNISLDFNTDDEDDDFLIDEYTPKHNDETIEPIQKIDLEQNKSLLSFKASLQNDDNQHISPVQQIMKGFAPTPMTKNGNTEEKSSIGSRLLVKKTIDKAQDTSTMKFNLNNNSHFPEPQKNNISPIGKVTLGSPNQDPSNQSDISFPSLPSFSPPVQTQTNANNGFRFLGGNQPNQNQTPNQMNFLKANENQKSPPNQISNNSHFNVPGIPLLNDEKKSASPRETITPVTIKPASSKISVKTSLIDKTSKLLNSNPMNAGNVPNPQNGGPVVSFQLGNKQLITQKTQNQEPSYNTTLNIPHTQQNSTKPSIVIPNDINNPSNQVKIITTKIHNSDEIPNVNINDIPKPQFDDIGSINQAQQQNNQEAPNYQQSQPQQKSPQPQQQTLQPQQQTIQPQQQIHPQIQQLPPQQQQQQQQLRPPQHVPALQQPSFQGQFSYQPQPVFPQQSPISTQNSPVNMTQPVTPSIHQMPNITSPIQYQPMQMNMHQSPYQTPYNYSQPSYYAPSICERVHISFMSTIDQSFSNLRRAMSSELSAAIRSQNRSAYNFDVDAFCNTLNAELAGVISFQLPQNDIVYNQALSRSLTNAIDNEINTISQSLEKSIERNKEINHKNQEMLHNLLSQLEALRISYKATGDGIVRELEREQLIISSLKDNDDLLLKEKTNKLRDLKLSTIDLESKLSQQHAYHDGIVNSFEKLLSQKKETKRHKIPNNNSKLKKVIYEMNDVNQEIKEYNYENVFQELDGIHKLLTFDQNSMRNELYEVEVAYRKLCQQVTTDVNGFAQQQSIQKQHQRQNQVFSQAVSPRRYNENKKQNSKMTDVNQKIDQYRQKRENLMRKSFV
ncbi:hypothetical protein TRFO_30195 [Tritrichomonas foetus]|uniref:Uncharacterized protein n=1 Tax=Tritrichomonas foetus TaxID=1144522 RepID=A0A1J4JU47_9EUKA|nr:hypothetical protein TRFO_30195 [Tritrichomonas foetus]|eukprot:OHT02657.1 hypothetical protein TRFO_30195 [Tritrichomonas foetus]